MCQRLLTICLFLGIFLSFCTPSFAQTTYIGPDNGLWSIPANWSNGLPAPSNKATIPGNGFTVLIDAPITFDFDVDNFSNITAQAVITNQGIFQSLGVFTIETTGGLINQGTLNNFQTTVFEGNATFSNDAGATFINGGTFTLPTTLSNQGDVTNNGTISAQQGLIQTQGSFSNNQIMSVTSLTVTANSTFVNNFGANLNITGTGAMFDADGTVTNNGTITSAGPTTVRGTFNNNVTFNVPTNGSLTIAAGAQFTNGGTVLNQATFVNNGMFTNGNNFYNEGTATNNLTFNQNNRVENRAGATFINGAAATWAQGFGSVLLNAGTFNQNNEFSSVGNLTNNNIFTNNGNYVNNSGGTITNAKTFTNNGSLASFFTITNNDVMMNNGQFIVSSGCILTNNSNFTNNTSGVLLNEFEIVNKTGGTFTNKGNLNNVVRMFVDGGSVINQAFFKNQGDIFTKTAGTLRNEGFFLQTAGNIKNEGTLRNLSEFISDICSSIHNTGAINNTGGNLKLQAILIQRGTLTGAAINNDGGYIHTAATSAAPSVCKNSTITADADGVVKAYATGLIAFSNFDSCQNIIYTANGIARPTFTCDDIGTIKNVNIKLVTRLGDSLTCVSQVTPTDFLAPEFSLCPTDITVNTVGNTAAAEWPTPVASDNCSNSVTMTSTHTSGASFPIGITAVTYKAVDDLNNENECQFKINVVKTTGISNCTNDNTAPVLSNCPTDFAVATNTPGAAITWTAPTVTDACKPLSLSSNFAPGRTFPLGRDTVTYTATDGNGNSSSCSFIVHVFQNDLCLTDNQKPVLSNCPSTIYLPLNATLNGALAIWDEPSASDNCAITSVIASKSSASVFPSGSTTVTYTATDGNNNTAACSFVVTVGADPCPGDNTAPVISNCPSNIVRNIASGTQAVANWTAPTATDPCSPVTLSSNYQSGANFNLGNTQVVYSASDAKGNKSTCAFNVAVQTPCSNDTEVPTISGCPSADITVATTATAAAVTWNTPSASDNCGLTSFGASYTSGAVFPVGVTSIVYTAFDTRGNSASCAFNVSVVNAPSCVVNAQPINNATAVATTNLTLLWDADNTASTYDVYLGLTASTTKLIAPNVVGTSIKVNDLNGGTDYFWRVVPKNAAGSATGCTTTTKFTTSGTPQTGSGVYGIDNSLPICKGQQGDGLTRQVWNNIPNATLDLLLTNANYPNTPNLTEVFAGSVSWSTGDNYGSRVRGYITPSVSGNYQFVITGDDQTRLFFAQNENPSNMFEVARIDGWTGQTEFTKFASQTSAAIFLTAGQNYYIELLQKEAGGGDGWGIYWKTPSNTTPTAIPLAMLSPISNDCAITTVSTGNASRVNANLVALYDFKEGSGDLVKDVSGVGTPLDLTIKHTGRVTRLANSCGLKINSGTIIKPAGSSSKISTAISASNEITIEAWVKPTNTTQTGPARIVTHSLNVNNRNFTLGQEGASFNARLRSSTSTANGFPEIISGVANTTLRHVLYTRNAAGQEYLYVDNEIVYSGTRAGTLSLDNSYVFALGNEITEDRPWLGEMHLVAVYSRALTTAEIGQNYHVGVCSTTNNNICNQNLIANGGFEQNSYGWVNSGGAIVTTPTASGTGAAQVCTSNSFISDGAPAEPGKTYTLTFKARISGSPITPEVYMGFVNQSIGGYNGYYKATITSTSYQTYTLTGVAPAGTYWVNVGIEKSGITGCAYLDEVCLTDGTLCANTLNIKNNATCQAKLYWVNNNTEVFYKNINAGATVNQETFDTHKWRVRRASDGGLIREYTMTGCNNQTITITNCGGSNGSGGTNDCSTDTEAPTFSACPVNQNLTTTGLTRTATWTPPTANDNCATPLVASNFQSGATFPLGITQVRYTAFDTKGNTAVCNFNITVTNACANDNQAPTLTACPANIVKNTNDVTTTTTWTPPTATDACGAVTLTSNLMPGAYFAPGLTVVRYTATDAKGNTATCTFNVTINSTNECANDTEAPAIQGCPNDIVATTSTTNKQVNWNNLTVTDNCTLQSFTATHIPGLIFPLGVTNVRYTAVDVSSNVTLCEFTVTVNQDLCGNDTEVPVIASCPTTIRQEISGTTSIISWTEPTASDNCSTPTLIANRQSGSSFSLGTTQVIYTATDAANNSSTCAFNVILTQPDLCANDTEAPVLSACPVDIVENIAGTSTMVTWAAPTVLDNCPNVTLSSSIESGASFNLGTTAVTYTATDATGNTATCSFSVTINQVVTGPDCSAIMFSGANGALTIGGLTSPVVLIQVFDNQWATAFSCTGNCNTPTQIINGLTPGNYYVKVDFLDATWSPICQLQEFVTVETGGGATGVLTFNPPADITVDAAAGENTTTVNYTAPTATTTCPTGMANVVRTSGLASGSQFPVGTTEVCYQATDACGNVKTACFNVTVNSTGAGDCDNINFTVGANSLVVGGMTTPISIIQVFNSQWAHVFKCAGDCNQPIQTINNLPAGTYFVRVDLLDQSWGTICSKEQYFNITGGNGSVISLSTPADITVVAATGASDALVTFAAPTGTTTCTTNSLVIAQTSGQQSGTNFPVGTTEVCYEATDNCGNLETVCFNVTVEATTTGGGANCNTIAFSTGAGSITVDNLVAPIVTIQLFDGAYAPVTNCFGNCTTPTQTFTGLTPGTYYVKVDYFSASWMPICQRNETLTVVNAAILQTASLTFSAAKEGETAKLNWITQPGAAIDYFVVERSENGMDFQDLMQKEARTSADELAYYAESDKNPLAGANYYRLRQIMADGTVRYSDTQRLDFAVATIFPNPAITQTFVNLKSFEGATLNLKLRSLTGRMIQEWTTNDTTDLLEISVETLESGLYFLEIQPEGARAQVLKVVVTK